jgi:hypothetical protein
MSIAMTIHNGDRATITSQRDHPGEVGVWLAFCLVLIGMVECAKRYLTKSVPISKDHVASIAIQVASPFDCCDRTVPTLQSDIAACDVGARHIQIAGVIQGGIRDDRISHYQRAQHTIISTSSALPGGLAVAAAKNDYPSGTGRADGLY